MYVLMGQYGFSKQEVNGVLDHRLLKFVNDMSNRDGLIREARERQGKKPAPRTTGKPAGKQSKTSALKDVINRARGGSQQEKIAAVSALISH